mmetsp:Transcript_14070/g.30024  ORF Transcript_14070/g.30024 Transcript_14070/m.30024 type:complete len:105 (-) Transcript_14070:63-377(-)
MLAVETQSSEPISHPLMDRVCFVSVMGVSSSANAAGGNNTVEKTALHAHETNVLRDTSLLTCSTACSDVVLLWLSSDGEEKADAEARHEASIELLTFIIRVGMD